MKKLMSYEHLDSGKIYDVEFTLVLEGDHWKATLQHRDEALSQIKAPMFYGAVQEQAERQLRKVFEKDYELVKEVVLEP